MSIRKINSSFGWHHLILFSTRPYRHTCFLDVYDLAEWCCINELSRISIEHGCAPVEVPDFTRGAWNKQEGFKFAL